MSLLETVLLWLFAVLPIFTNKVLYLKHTKMNEIRKNVSVNKPIACWDGTEKKHGNKVESKTQKKTNLMQKDGMRQEEYSTFIMY